MARIDYVDPESANERTNELLDKLGHRNIFRMLGHSARHFETYVRMGNAVRFKGELDDGLREIAITRTGILCGSEYEVVAHKRLAKGVGVSAEKIAALEEGEGAAPFTSLENLVLRFTDEAVTMERVSDDTFEAMALELTPAALVELHLAIGFYIMTSKFLVTFGVDLQQD